MQRARIILFGRVQGVNFRNFARQEAEKLNIVGFIRNNPDGTVEILGEGNEHDLNKFVQACKKGPFLAFVQKAEIVFSEPTGEYEEFEVKP